MFPGLETIDENAKYVTLGIQMSVSKNFPRVY